MTAANRGHRFGRMIIGELIAENGQEVIVATTIGVGAVGRREIAGPSGDPLGDAQFIHVAVKVQKSTLRCISDFKGSGVIAYTFQYGSRSLGLAVHIDGYGVSGSDHGDVVPGIRINGHRGGHELRV